MTLLSTAPTEAETHFASAAMPAEAAARTMPTLAPVTIIEKEGTASCTLSAAKG